MPRRENMFTFTLVIFIIIHVLSDYYVNCSEEPLILTPYLEAGKIEEAQEKARVTPDMNGVKSYSGFFTVDKKCGSNLFFWFVLAQNNWEEAPVLLWLNGGPGISSMVGMFTGIGPFNHFKKSGFVDNKYHWTKNNNVLFLDQPVGTGFSFSEKGCYADTLTVVAQNAYSAIEQFFTLFPKLQKNNFFMTGYSFAANYIPAIINEIHKKNNTSVKLNLKGIVILSPFIDRRCHHTGKFLYEMGIIDENVLQSVTEFEKKLFTAIDEKNITGAAELDYQIGAVQIQFARLPSYANVLIDSIYYPVEFAIYIRNYKVREQIHVGDAMYIINNNTVAKQLNHLYYEPANEYIQDILKSEKYILGLVGGHLNVFSPYTAAPCVLRQLEWPGSEKYLAVNRTLWYVDGRLAGYLKVAGNLFEVMVRDSGNDIHMDQGKAALELITAVVADNPGSKLLTKLDTE